MPLPNKYREDKIDEMVLVLMYLCLDRDDRTWKGFDWASLNRLHEKDLISNPVSKAKSVVLTEAGKKMSEQLFKKYFVVD